MPPSRTPSPKATVIPVHDIINRAICLGLLRSWPARMGLLSLNFACSNGCVSPRHFPVLRSRLSATRLIATYLYCSGLSGWSFNSFEGHCFRPSRFYLRHRLLTTDPIARNRNREFSFTCPMLFSERSRGRERTTMFMKTVRCCRCRKACGTVETERPLQGQSTLSVIRRVTFGQGPFGS